MNHPLTSLAETYRHRFHVREPYYTLPPAQNLSLIITIPAWKEPDIGRTLQSLAACRAPSGPVEIIVTINAPEGASGEDLVVNRKSSEQIEAWEKTKPEFMKMLVIREEAMPVKHAGAGAARKIGMDEAVQRWAMINKDGPIVCLDADCTVSDNYLVEAELTFRDPCVRVGHFHFEHPYEHEQNVLLRNGILHYELHLRCYRWGLRLADYPFAIHTVGSCVAVRASAYALAGGMNRRKAGEDFYFLHKLVPSGGWRDISEAVVYPSCRISDRVPFGTGRAQMEWQSSDREGLTYNGEVYDTLKPVFNKFMKWYTEEVDLSCFHPEVRSFLEEHNINHRLKEMKRQSTSAESFLKRCWQWMDGFLVMKFVHHLRDQGFPDQPVMEVGKKLIEKGGLTPSDTIEELLYQFRSLDRS